MFGKHKRIKYKHECDETGESTVILKGGCGLCARYKESWEKSEPAICHIAFGKQSALYLCRTHAEMLRNSLDNYLKELDQEEQRQKEK